MYISSPASTMTQDSARPGEGRGDLEPQITTFNESFLSKNGSELDYIFFNPLLKILSWTECEFNANRPIRYIAIIKLKNINNFFIIVY